MNRWRVAIAGGMLAVLFVAVYFMGFRQPRSEAIAGLAAETEQLRAQQVPLRRDIKGLEHVAANEAELTTALQSLERRIPSGLAQPSVLTQLQASADAAGVKIESVTFGDPEVPEGAPSSHIPGTVLVAMPVTVAVEGRYAEIADLLHRVEVDFDRAVLVGTIALTQGEAGFPQLAGTWAGQVYALLPAGDPLLVDPDAPPVAPPPPVEQPTGAK